MAGLVPTQGMASDKGFVRWTPNSEIDRLETEAILAQRPDPPQALSDLASHIRTFWQAAKTAKLPIEQKMLSILRQVKGEYEPDKLQAIKDMGGSDDFVRLTYHKCRDVEAWLDDILNSFGDRTWDIEPESNAEIPPDIAAQINDQVRSLVLQQAVAEAQATGQPVDASVVIQTMREREAEVRDLVLERAQALAEERATNMQLKISDQFNEGGWNKAFKACLNDLTRMKACILKGPIYRKEDVATWDQDPSGQWKVTVTKKVVPKFERVSPFDWYPAPNSTCVDDGDSIEVEHPTRSDLNKFIGMPGYKEDMIRAALNEHSGGHRESTPIDATRYELEKGTSTNLFDQTSSTIDMLNYWGKVQGKMLLEWGMTPEEVPDPDLDYQINAKMIGNYIIKAVINPDPLGSKPYGVASFIKSNDSQWGECPPEVMEDLQSICNASVRALVNNMAIASGPLTEIDVDRLAPGESPDLWPHKVIQTTNKRMVEGPAVRFYQANLLANDLIRIYENFKKEADDLVVPAYGHGNADVGGAGKTSSGLSMLMSGATRTIKLALSNVDNDLIIPAVRRMFHHNMRFLDDDSIKGALRVKPRGINSNFVKEQMAMRRKELLAETNNPMDQQIMGLKGRAYLLSENVKALEMDPERALPNMEAIERMPVGSELMAPAPVPGQQAGSTLVDNAGKPSGGGENNLFQQQRG